MGLDRRARPLEVLAAVVLSVLVGAAAGLSVWSAARAADPGDLMWCRRHPEDVGLAAVAFQIDLAEEGGASRACALARDLGHEHLVDLVRDRYQMPRTRA